ncbi:MAG: class I SAM-dependent methyltransferase [Dehalococcoidia bacterium]|nr:class I SAM-dependent methyltransferase [Dehalococcoidia bacterium]
MTEIAAYNEAFKSGQYQKPEGLLGKYDNVRRFWEDEVLGLYLRPYLKHLVARRKESGGGIRVLDLGCGSGDGLEFITSISDSSSLLSEHNTKVIGPDMLGAYKGIDINAAMLEQAQSMYGSRPNVTFVQSSFNDYDVFNEEPCELYLANYGTLSHNTDQQTVGLLSNIARHGKDGAIIMLDWLGRFSYEWQTLWTMDFEHNQWMDYVISYIYSDGKDEKHQELAHFPLRIMGRKEALQIYRQVRRNVGDVITLRKLADRSSLVGRHMDTAQYNVHCQPLRRLVNSLFEPNQCTNLDAVLVNYVPGDGFAEVNAYYHRLAGCWNYLVTYTRALFEESKPPEAMPEMPLPLRKSLGAMKRVVRTASGMKTGAPRTSLVEPQLAYCLRELEMALQKGLGCGHGLVAIFEIVK